MTADANALRGLCLTGPTGCAKTELALALAAQFPLEIVSMDSALVYRGMDIGTAKPSRSVRDEFPHHLVDVRDPETAYSAGEFRRDALSACAAIRERGKWPLLVGGTLLYLRALRAGLADLPERDPGVRAAIDAEAATRGWGALHARLAASDPQSAARIGPADRQRIQRALEVQALTGRTLTELTRRAVPPAGATAAIVVLAVVPDDRRALGVRLAQRLHAMVEAGFVAEVRTLRARPQLTSQHASMRSVGYRQIWAHLAGETDWEQTEQRALAATRQLAKRQMTWLRAESDCEFLPAFAPELGRLLRERVARQLDEWA